MPPKGMKKNSFYGKRSTGWRSWDSRECFTQKNTEVPVSGLSDLSAFCWRWPRFVGPAREYWGFMLPSRNPLPGMTLGKTLGAFAITEPGAGSDSASLQTSARKEKDFYSLNGNKVFITSDGEAAFYLVVAKTDKTQAARGVRSFLV